MKNRRLNIEATYLDFETFEPTNANAEISDAAAGAKKAYKKK